MSIGGSDRSSIIPQELTAAAIALMLAPYALGAASSTDNAIVRFDGTTGKTIQNSGITINDSNYVTFPTSTINITNGGSLSVGSGYFTQLGSNNTISLTGTATKATVVGNNNTLTMATAKDKSTILGDSNNGGGAGNTIVGVGNIINVSSSFATAVGYENNIGAAGDWGIAVGYTSSVNNGGFSIAVGQYNKAHGQFNAALGCAVEATGSDGCVAFGVGLYCTARSAGILGVDPSYAATNSTADSFVVCFGSNFVRLDANRTSFTNPAKLATYTVATLPTGAAGDTAYVTNALAPTFGAAVVGGGAVGTPVYKDGTSWKVG